MREVTVGRHNRCVQFTSDRCDDRIAPDEKRVTGRHVGGDLPRRHRRSFVDRAFLAPRERRTSACDIPVREVSLPDECLGVRRDGYYPAFIFGSMLLVVALRRLDAGSSLVGTRPTQEMPNEQCW